MRLASRSKTRKKDKRPRYERPNTFRSDHALVERLKMKGYEGRDLAKIKNKILKEK